MNLQAPYRVPASFLTFHAIQWPMRTPITCTILLLAMSLAGCRLGGSESLDQVADRLRSENAELHKKLDAAQNENLELRTKLAGIPESTHHLSSEMLAAIPRCTHIELDSLSGWSARRHALSLYVKTLDGRDRFVQVTGTLHVTLMIGNQAPRELTFTPAQLRDAYRSDIVGTCYLATFDGMNDLPGKGSQIRIRFNDGLSETPFECAATLDDAGRVVASH